MQKVTCPASMPAVACNKYIVEGKNRWRRGHAWLMLIEAKFVPGTVKILFSTYLPCENIVVVIVPTYPCVLVVSHFSTSWAGLFYHLYSAQVSALPVITLLMLLTWSVCISLRYLTRQCSCMRLCPKALPRSRLGGGIGPSCEQCDREGSQAWEWPLQLLPCAWEAPSCHHTAHHARWFSATIRTGLPFPAALGWWICAHTASQSRAEV